MVLPLALFLLGYSGAFQAAGKGLTLFFKYYTDAELQKLEASGFINPDGNAEYVVGLYRDRLVDSGEAFLLSTEGVSEVRPTSFSDWYVITLAVGDDNPAQKLRDRDETRFVLQNRGLWICH